MPDNVDTSMYEININANNRRRSIYNMLSVSYGTVAGMWIGRVGQFA
jgi:hypothetical protein